MVFVPLEATLANIMAPLSKKRYLSKLILVGLILLVSPHAQSAETFPGPRDGSRGRGCAQGEPEQMVSVGGPGVGLFLGIHFWFWQLWSWRGD